MVNGGEIGVKVLYIWMFWVCFVCENYFCVEEKVCDVVK